MKVTGFTIVRNAVLYDYPVLESIASLLPLVDEVVVAVGKSSDATRELVASMDSPKIRIFDTIWDDALRSGGRVLAQQTNLAMDVCGPADWFIYLQADEVLHEQDAARIRSKMQQHLRHATVEGLSFRYHHFRADYHIRDPLPYRRQVRIIRPGIGIRSVGDACGFRLDGQKLKTVSTGAWVYHYGYVKPPPNMSAKMDYFTSLYDGRPVVPGEENIRNYAWNLTTCEHFLGTHPNVMRGRIANKNWETPQVALQSRWRNPKYYGGLFYKNTRALRRWAESARNLISKAA